MSPQKHIIVTGGAGFIGSHIVDSLMEQNFRVTVVDCLDDFYDPRVKMENIRKHLSNPHFSFYPLDITEAEALESRLDGQYDAIIHLAARVGVRESVMNPALYDRVNTEGTLNLLNFARKRNILQFILASSSSVYGLNPDIPWREDADINAIISPYAVSKRAAELYGMTYSRLFGMRVLVLRLFTVYGPRQRPDLAIHRFAKLMLKGEPLRVFGNGDSSRDYTYVTDVANAFVKALEYDQGNFEIFNIGHNTPVQLSDLIGKLEQTFGKKAKLEYTGLQTGDVPVTCADIRKAMQALDYQPGTALDDGLASFRSWLTGSE